MALQANNEAIAGLSTFWQDQNSEPKIMWDRWTEFFAVAMMTKFSIAKDEFVREEGVEPRRTALMGGLDQVAAERKTVSVLFFSIGRSSKKNFGRQKPATGHKGDIIEKNLG